MIGALRGAVRVLSALAWLSCASCGYRLVLGSQPPATVLLPDGSLVSTPAEVRLRYVPFGHQRVVASADGYRSCEIDLREDAIRLLPMVIGTLAHPATLAGRPRTEVRIVLVPEHGPSGTWTPEEIP